MRAAVYHGPRDIRVEDVDTPGIAKDEMLVQVRACGICGSDLHVYRLGVFEDQARPVGGGLVLGHELAGEVVELGSRVAGFRVGDRIAGAARGSFAEYVPVQVSERGPHPLPPSVSFVEGATLEPLACTARSRSGAACRGRDSGHPRIGHHRVGVCPGDTRDDILPDDRRRCLGQPSGNGPSVGS